jgi:hypothetical protein
MRATGTFHVEDWQETTLDTPEGGSKITRASVRQRFAGDFEGDGAVDYMMAYRSDGTATFTGIQRLRGAVAGRTGTLVIEVTGTFDGAMARGQWTIVSEMGTEGLSVFGGTGSFEAAHGPDGTYVLDLPDAG